MSCSVSAGPAQGHRPGSASARPCARHHPARLRCGARRRWSRTSSRSPRHRSTADARSWRSTRRVIGPARRHSPGTPDRTTATRPDRTTATRPRPSRRARSPWPCRPQGREVPAQQRAVPAPDTGHVGDRAGRDAVAAEVLFAHRVGAGRARQQPGHRHVRAGHGIARHLPASRAPQPASRGQGVVLLQRRHPGVPEQLGHSPGT